MYLARLIKVLFILGLMINTAFAGSTLKPFEAVYDVVLRHGSVKAEGTTYRSLKHIGDEQYRYEVTAKVEGILFLLPVSYLREESSEFLWKNNRPAPLSYSLQTSGIGKERSADLIFNWDKLNVTNHTKHEPWELSITDGTQDPLSYHFLVGDVVSVAQNASPYEFTVATDGRLKTYQMVVVGDESVSTPAGTFLSTKIKRQRKKRTTYLWVDKKTHRIIRIQQFKDEKEQADMVLRSFSEKTV